MSTQRRSSSRARPSNTTAGSSAGGGSRSQGSGRGRRPPQHRGTRVVVPAPRPIVHRPIDPWSPASSGTLRALFARLAPLLIVVVGAVVGVAVSLAAGAVILLCGLALFASNEYIANPRHLLKRLGGRVIASHEQPGLRNIVEGLCFASGQAVPEIRILHEDAPNALLLYRSKGEAVLVCTSGLLRDLDRIELEGVVAHELAHLKNGDARRAAHAMAACGSLAWISSVTPRFVLGLGDPRREALADLGASAMTRYPPGLAAALEAIAHAPSGRVQALDEVSYRLTAPLWCAPLNADEPHKEKAGVLDLSLRVEALAEL